MKKSEVGTRFFLSLQSDALSCTKRLALKVTCLNGDSLNRTGHFHSPTATWLQETWVHMFGCPSWVSASGVLSQPKMARKQPWKKCQLSTMNDKILHVPQIGFKFAVIKYRPWSFSTYFSSGSAEVQPIISDSFLSWLSMPSVPRFPSLFPEKMSFLQKRLTSPDNLASS